MSGSNGTDPHYAEAARLAHTLGKPIMTARDREQQREAYIAAVDGMATVLRQTVEQVGTLAQSGEESLRRLDTLERDAAVGRAFRSASFMARLRWLVLGPR